MKSEIEKQRGFWCWSMKGYPIFSGPKSASEKQEVTMNSEHASEPWKWCDKGDNYGYICEAGKIVIIGCRFSREVGQAITDSHNAAIEKATEQLRTQLSEAIRDRSSALMRLKKQSRAAHASEWERRKAQPHEFTPSNAGACCDVCGKPRAAHASACDHAYMGKPRMCAKCGQAEPSHASESPVSNSPSKSELGSE